MPSHSTDAASGSPHADYLLEVEVWQSRPDVSEGSLYPATQRLLEHWGRRLGLSRVEALLLPRRTEWGCPDFRVSGPGGRLVGYVEVKRPDADPDLVRKTSQLRRYLQGHPNLLLLAGLEMRLFRHGEPIGEARVEIQPSARDLLSTFFSYHPAPHKNAESLARSMAAATRILALHAEALLAPEEPRGETLRGLHDAFTRYLVPDLSGHRFADLYAQTVAYGLFAARHHLAETRPDATFTRQEAFSAVPATHGVLQDLFRYVFLKDPPREILWCVDDLVEMLAVADLPALFRETTRSRKDPVHHFYETFLAAYDPELRKRRGVYYTPPEVVSYIVRSVHHLLDRELGYPGGLAHRKVRLLDPAAGTLAFPVEAVRQAFDAYRERCGPNAHPGRFRDELLERFLAVELLVAPYAIGHLKAAVLFSELGCPLESHQRLAFYLGNALETKEPRQGELPPHTALSEEARHVLGLREMPIPVVLGNPPYAGHSANREARFRDLLEGWERPDGTRDDGCYRVDGEPLDERNTKWLQDDYVKFLRFAQWKIDQAGHGVVAFVTNHGYLDNPTFRGFRESLLDTFDRLYLLDLHGNQKKGEHDANVFDGVRQGVAIALLVKLRETPRSSEPKRVLRADLRGSQREKLAWLDRHDVGSTSWEEIRPRSPLYLFEARDAELEDRFRSWPAVNEIFELGSVGVVTGDDAHTTAFSEDELRLRVSRDRSFIRTSKSGQIWEPSDKIYWKQLDAQRDVSRDEWWRFRVRPYLFRPFDRRAVLYADYALERSRWNVMQHFFRDNVGLVVTKQHKKRPGAFVTDRITAHKVVSPYDICYVFPLWRYPEEVLAPEDREAQARLFTGEPLPRTPNLDRAFRKMLEHRYGRRPEPEDVLGHVYAVLSSPRYLETYAELLKTGFPRIPFPDEWAAFRESSRLGRELIDLHLLRDERLDDAERLLCGEGSDCIGRRPRRDSDWLEDEEALRLNEDDQLLRGISREIWRFRIGGHRVLRSYLNTRKGRPLLPDLRHLERTVAAIRHTLALADRLDAAEMYGGP